MSGSRHNVGRPEKNHMDRAVYVGAVGARFERQERMEWQEMVVTKKQNTKGKRFHNTTLERTIQFIYLFIYLENGYGKGARKTLNSVFAPFYGLDHFPTFQECSSSDKDGVVKRNQDTFFHEAVFQQRIEVSAEIFLLEANDRGKVQRFPKCTHGRWGGGCPSPSVQKPNPSPRAKTQGPSKKLSQKQGKIEIFENSFFDFCGFLSEDMPLMF